MGKSKQHPWAETAGLGNQVDCSHQLLTVMPTVKALISPSLTKYTLATDVTGLQNIFQDVVEIHSTQVPVSQKSQPCPCQLFSIDSHMY